MKRTAVAMVTKEFLASALGLPEGVCVETVFSTPETVRADGMLVKLRCDPDNETLPLVAEGDAAPLIPLPQSNG